ncbi:MAG: hypothetical protein JXB38_12515 [Anaerolineales bacterium]|nr:hypothetical protein [Anaerolineales bacterium]
MQREQIVIYMPEDGTTLSDGVAHVEGFGLASFEATLLVEIQDTNGDVVASQPVMVEAPGLDQPGTFSADITYTANESGPGRIVVRDTSPTHGEDNHLNSVEITLEP